MRALYVALAIALAAFACALALFDEAPPEPSPVVRSFVREDPVSPLLEFATTDETSFRRLGPPQPGDWLDRFDEEGMTFDRYARSRPVRPDAEASRLAFVLVGPFSPEEREVAESSVVFAGLWFRLETVTHSDRPLPESGWQRSREFPWRPGETVTQYRTDWFLDHQLPRLVPADAVCLMAVTMGDLYPEESWNYVFGISTFRRRVAVSSFARYFPGFWGEPDTQAARRLALLRSISVTVHEIGHAFGLPHCIEYECGMNGSNSLTESDRRPMFLCPPCLKKLQWNIGFDVLARYRGLAAFFREHGLAEEESWVLRRFRLIEGAR